MDEYENIVTPFVETEEEVHRTAVYGLNKLAAETIGKTPEEIYDLLYWLMFDYGKQFTDTRLAVIKWLSDD